MKMMITFMSDNAIWFALGLCCLMLIAVVAHMWFSPGRAVPFLWGVALILAGLLSYLYSHLGRPGLLPEQIDALRTLFVIVSGIGANILAGAASARNAERAAQT
jgi:hypothetical protein